MTARLVAVAPFALCAALYAGAMQGQFLSDDMSVIFVLAGWQERGHLWTELLHKFAAGLDAQSNYYRPLPFLSFGANLATGPHSPLAWHLVNLAGHLAAGAAVYRLVRLLDRDPQGPWIPAFAAALFLLFGTNAEAVAWISGRYDVLATAFLLWGAALAFGAKRALDARALGGLLCGLLALASKESAAVLPGVVACLAWVKHGEQSFALRWRRIAVDVTPWLALIGGYFALRWLIFGSALQVYPGTHPLERLRGGTFMPATSAAWTWFAAALPNRPFLSTAFALTGVLLLVGAIAAMHNGRTRRALSGASAATLLSLAMLLPHLSGLPANGEGGRLLYTTSALLAIVCALAVSSIQSHGIGWWNRVAGLACGALIAGHAVLLDAALVSWRTAGRQMARLTADLGALARTVPPDGYGFIVAPDSIGSVPFARNAQGAIAVPPIQAEWLLNREVVYVPTDLAVMPDSLAKGIIPVLKQLRRNERGDQLEDSRAEPQLPDFVLPTDMLCWAVGDGGLRRIEVPAATLAPVEWQASLRRQLRDRGCAYPPQ